MKTLACPPVKQVIQVMKRKRYRVFDSPKGHDLNIVGIRSRSIEANSFNDWITIFYTFDGNWVFFGFPATTDPGTFYRKNPMNVKGTAVLKPGQYRGAYKIGRHNTYKALRQKRAMTVFRDANRNRFLDTSGMEEESGIFFTNLHRANAHRPSTVVGKWSAGCQVIQDPDHFAFVLALCERARGKFGNSFTYTLLEEKDFPGS